ncbi:MAG: hypothetical protein A2785_01855 [Candidatus Chisholmbacteria bacterium RIFCSPHIGHO2_01_FULL_49_18]|uniref:Uncharacterized protein n=2 Tax=Candidatus Chisholmiibacteriota TaxID=1817900 RepID=A0A1G1VMU6_9BACT|nr:MAG: hypothetical protein A2785_01855 [Candidatus Chisholmbacteria bacterium RIFCSPHIGHO2_01_FULL_49_18]OGY21340.1 MAG: hypothetical protein A3A65_05240 [Candidatus Chisholmbacteria bacterium RIFCSPLOWO2_01_FULL_49_14]
MANNPDNSTTNPEVARFRALSSITDEHTRKKHAGVLPFDPQGQAIGKAETRREEIEAALGAATVRAAAADPETFTKDPEPKPDVIDVQDRSPRSR